MNLKTLENKIKILKIKIALKETLNNIKFTSRYLNHKPEGKWYTEGDPYAEEDWGEYDGDEKGKK